MGPVRGIIDALLRKYKCKLFNERGLITYLLAVWNIGFNIYIYIHI